MYGDEGRQQQDILAQPTRSTGELARLGGETRAKPDAESRPAPAGRKAESRGEEAAAAGVAIVDVQGEQRGKRELEGYEEGVNKYQEEDSLGRDLIRKEVNRENAESSAGSGRQIDQME